MIGQDCNLRQDADAETDRNCGLDAGEIGAGIRGVPAPPCGLDGVDHSIAIKAALFKHHQGHGVTVQVDAMPLACNPTQLLGPRRNYVASASVAFV